MSTIYETVTAKIIAAIENGAGDWRMPWHCKANGGAPLTSPVNAARGYAYRGSNVLTLWAAGEAAGYPTGIWATYKQWSAMGCQVRKGEKGTMSVFWKRFEATAAADEASDDDDNSARRGGLMARAAFVFNAAQVDGYTPAETPAVSWDPLERAEAFIRETCADIRHGGTRAFYMPGPDAIALPDRGAFRSRADYYATALHELAHWTGHARRCAREFGKRFGDDAYAVEELTAELAAAFMCAELGIANEPRPDHAQYLSHWLGVLKRDARAIFTVASAAQKACDYARSLQPVPTVPLAA